MILSGLKIHSKWDHVQEKIPASALDISSPGCFERNLSFGAPNWVIPVGIEPLAP